MTPQPRRQRRMSNIQIDEVSAVDNPAHLVEGWVIQKAADKPDVPAGAFLLKDHERYLVAAHLDALKPGEEVDFPASGKGARLGKSAKGVSYLTTPASIEKAAGQEWARSRNVGQRPL